MTLPEEFCAAISNQVPGRPSRVPVPARQRLEAGAMLLLALAVGGSLGCGRSSSKATLPPAPPPTPSKTAQPIAPGLIVYLDTSKSMAGFARTEQTPFARVLKTLRALDLGLVPEAAVMVRRVDASVGDVVPASELAEAAHNPSRFSGSETDLAGAFAAFSTPLKGASGPSRYHVLLTDGVQSTASGRHALDCARGSDEVCVRRQIDGLLKNDWSGVILAVRSPFRGTFYSELPKDPLKPKSRVFPVDTGTDSADGRPLYIYVFSPEMEGAGRVVNAMISSLREADIPVQAIPLSMPIVSRPCRLEFLPALKEEKEPGKGKRLTDIRLLENESRRVTVRLETKLPSNLWVNGPRLHVECEWQNGLDKLVSRGPVPNPGAPQTKEADAANRRPEEYLVWDVRRVYLEPAPADSNSAPHLAAQSSVSRNTSPSPAPSASGSKDVGKCPEIMFAPGATSDSRGWIFSTRASWPEKGREPAWAIYRVEARIPSLGEGPALPWEAWSTDDDTVSSNVNRTLNLKTSLGELWKMNRLRDQVVVDATIQIGPSN